MQNALIIGSSGGIGAALVAGLRAKGGAVTGLSRSADGLDITNETSVAQHLGKLSGPFDLIVVATGALATGGHQPEKTIRSLTADGLRSQFDVNTIGPALVLKHSIRLLPRDRRAVFAALSARVGSIGDNALGGWYSYRSAKSALNQILHTAAIELARSHPQAVCVALHPGTVETDFTAKYLGRHPAVAASVAAENLLDVISGLTSGQSGGFYDWQGKQVVW
ncbi:SDR family NAD(P)-dependent oxidoreductase [Pseudogemmobacter sp. W21_MBD1_M6]|uniref:SDR family NAD(P)-dependent oxidoreductase n=1 Tax=Pseudogemmobacter sp. W21_MBD1_M6 TaxID=3240271 RepID=UPI003F974C64